MRLVWKSMGASIFGLFILIHSKGCVCSRQVKKATLQKIIQLHRKYKKHKGSRRNKEKDMLSKMDRQ